MRYLAVALTLVAGSLRVIAADLVAENVRSSNWLKPEEEQKTFHLPPGFEIQLVASEPDILKPMNMAFDNRGRLWVTVTREYPYPVALGKPGRDAIKILEDTDGDGRADRITTFADGLNIPIGIYPYRDGCIAWSIPNIWYFKDTDHDGVADQREILFGPFDHTRDTHGNQASFRRGFDGWLYATHGYNNDSHVQGRDGHQVHLNSGNTYRMRLDGSRLEHYTHGQVNPFGLAFDALGNLYSSDCHSSPIYQLLAGGYYPSFGKPDDGLGFAPIMIDRNRGSTALDGISYYADDLWPEEYRDSLFVGDVMLSVITRDRAAEKGGTKSAEAQPDFVTTDDPWFRPVDTQLGPDGALYIADFYNRIIGHYEVPLSHPGRDRTSGRIWRVVYRGSDGQLGLHAKRNLSTATAAELVATLDHPNLTVRRRAADEIQDRIGLAAVPLIKEAIAEVKTAPFKRVECLWLLYRLNAIEDDILQRAIRDSNRLVRVHSLRIATAQKELNSLLRQEVIEALKDPDGLVVRCAAETLAAHPNFENLAPLLQTLQATPGADTHLHYVMRKAVRDQLLVEETFQRVIQGSWSETDSAALADVALGVQSASAGIFLIRQASVRPPDGATATAIIRHAARYAPDRESDALAKIVRTRFPNDVDLQLSLLTSLQEGLEQRGTSPNKAIQEWASELVSQVLERSRSEGQSWSFAALAGADKQENPWFLQRRISADGNRGSKFLCSLPPGGESLTGILRSQPFIVPDTLTFWIAGHDGYPGRASNGRNYVRLLALPDSEKLAEAAPPRNDTAQKVVWELKEYAGRRAVFEVTDGDNGDAFAWLAFGRFNPAIVPWPSISPNAIGRRQQEAADLAGKLKLTNARPALVAIVESNSDAAARSAAAVAMLKVDPPGPLMAVAPFVGDITIAETVRSRLATSLTHGDARGAYEALATALRQTPQRTQIRIAQALASTAEGSESLLETIAAGQVSPRVLLDRNVKDKIAAVRPKDGVVRLALLTKSLPPINVQLQELAAQRRRSYEPSQANPVAGVAVFTKNCAACHSIDRQGGNVGPQLDGIGARGLERLCEDVLDPNRNVDRAFRNSLVTLKDGDIVSGLFRREEGETIVLADSTGKEISIPKKKIEERQETDSSLMPENFGEVITPVEFSHLMAFLLSKGAAPEK